MSILYITAALAMLIAYGRTLGGNSVTQAILFNLRALVIGSLVGILLGGVQR